MRDVSVARFVYRDGVLGGLGRGHSIGCYSIGCYNGGVVGILSLFTFLVCWLYQSAFSFSKHHVHLFAMVNIITSSREKEEYIHHASP